MAQEQTVNKKPIIVIGSGQAGVSFVREFRKINKEQPLTLICADAGGFYSKPMLSNAFVKNMPLDRLQIQDAATLGEKTQTKVLPLTRVQHIDVQARTIEVLFADATTSILEYHKLVLAVGATPIKAPIPGLESALSVNHLDEYKTLRKFLDSAECTPKSIAIIGGGLVGCELANDLHLGGHKITLIEREAQLLPRLASPQIAHNLKEKFEALGIQVLTGVCVQSLESSGTPTGGGEAFEIATDHANTGKIQAQRVISALGLTPNTELAKNAGLKIQKGVGCNRELQTSNEHIYALGDCIEIENQVLPYILPIMEGAKALAATLNGSSTNIQYPCMPVAVKTSSYPMVVSPPFTAASENIELKETSTDAGFQTLYYVKEQLVGFCLAGDATTQRQSLASQCRGILEAL